MSGASAWQVMLPGDHHHQVMLPAQFGTPARQAGLRVCGRAISRHRLSLEPPISLRLPDSPGVSLRLGRLARAEDSNVWVERERDGHLSHELPPAVSSATPMSAESDNSQSTVSADTSDIVDDLRVADNFMETDRTSVCSSDDWADCEYDVQAGKHVTALFEQIDSALYRPDPPGSVESLPRVTRAECSEWRFAFPHLRVRGSQAAAARESGFEMLDPPQSDATPRPQRQQQREEQEEEEEESNSPFSCLTVTAAPICSASDSASPAFEEVLAVEGCVEESIAVDDRSGSPDSGQSAARRRRFSGHAGATRGLPPLTPSLALRDSALDVAFDCAWRVVSSAVRPLVFEHLRRQRTREGDQRQEEEDDDDVDEFALDDAASQATGVGESEQMARTSQRAPTSMSTSKIRQRESLDFGGCLSIKSKTLQLRDARHAVSPVLRDIPESPAPPPPAAFSRVGSGRRPQRLAPVDSRARTPATVDEESELRGGGAAGGLLALRGVPLYASFVRSGTLPPLQDKRPLRAGQANRPSSGRPGAQSSLDLQLHRHRRQQQLDIHGRSLAAAEADAACDHAVPYRAYQLQLGQATSSFYRRPRQSHANIRR